MWYLTSWLVSYVLPTKYFKSSYTLIKKPVIHKNIIAFLTVIFRRKILAINDGVEISDTLQVNSAINVMQAIK